MNMGNFKQMLSETGNALLVKRADQIAQICRDGTTISV